MCGDTENTTIPKIAVEYALRTALLEIMVYFCPVNEPMTNTEEMFPFGVEVLHGVLMGTCLEREEGKYLV